MRLIQPYDLLLDASTGWRSLEATGISTTGPLSLEPLAARRLPVADPSGTFGQHTLPRGVVVWDGGILIADPPRHRILWWRACCGPARPLPTIGGRGHGPRQLDRPLGLALSEHGDLVVADTGNHRLLLLTLPGLALRRIVGPYLSRYAPPVTPVPPPEIAEDECRLPVAPDTTAWWQPVDVAAGPGGRLYVADGDGSVWRLDAQGRADPHYPGRLPNGCVPWRVAADAQGYAYILAEPTTGPGTVRLLILDGYGRLVSDLAELQGQVDAWLALHQSPAEMAADGDPAAPPAIGCDTEASQRLAAQAQFAREAQARAALLPPGLSQRIDTWLRRRGFDLVWTGRRAEMYDVQVPAAWAELLPGFVRDVLAASPLSVDGERVALDASGPGACLHPPQLTDLLLDEEGRLRLSDPAAGPGPYLGRRPPAARFVRAGLFRPEALDSGRLGNAWHRVVIELDAPERTEVRLFSFTSDVPRPDLTVVGLLAEPLQPGPWQVAPAAGLEPVYEWLIQSPPGRYLYLALVLRGPGNVTPVVKRIYIYAQRRSSLHYLPATYQADPVSRDLLDRFLSLTDTIFGEIESLIEEFPFYLDLEGTPADFLPWLASWFDLQFEQRWSEEQRRTFLKQAVTLYRQRGTRRGLQLLLRLHLGLDEDMPAIVEHFRGGSQPALETWLRASAAGDAAVHFTVVLPGYTVDTSEKRNAVDRLVTAYKPAHTHYSLRPLFPGLRLGSAAVCGTALGVDSLLGSQANWRLPSGREHDGILGARTVLPAPSLPWGVAQLGVSRLGLMVPGGSAAPNGQAR